MKSPNFFSEKVKKLKIRKNRGILNHYFWVLQMLIDILTFATHLVENNNVY